VLVPIAVGLDEAVHSLVTQFHGLPMSGTDLAVGTYETLENTMQYEMTGETDEGSHTNLATAWANIEGTQLALSALAPLLRQTGPGLLSQLEKGLTAMAAAFKSYQAPNGTWEPLQSLTTSQQESLDGQLGSLLEELSVLPEVLQPIQTGTAGS
jgi:iron uptake system EfeUOB component EfeO/EfeM